MNPNKVRLVPGESFQGFFSLLSKEPVSVGFFIRPISTLKISDENFDISQRAGLIRFNDVLLVLTMIKFGGETQEIFDIWWNYHSQNGEPQFQRMAEQESLPINIYRDTGERSLVESENTFRKFFGYLTVILSKTRPWTQVEFDRAVRGFCAQSYPREHLWDSIEIKANVDEPLDAKSGGIENYPGTIPDELRSYYSYVPEQGHCIRIIPSMLELEAQKGNPSEYLHAAPVKTVLRCGIRWVYGHPVAPIPFIPGYGLAIPPDDIEF